jgi:hypothetical protein
MISLTLASETMKLENPAPSSTLSVADIRGFLRSSSISSTFLPEIARAQARFIATNDFPSPPMLEVVMITFPKN